MEAVALEEYGPHVQEAYADDRPGAGGPRDGERAAETVAQIQKGWQV